MRNTFTAVVTLILLCVIITSCEKTIDLALDEKEPKLVVEAVIENDLPPVVTLTKSLNFFQQVDPALLANSFVRNAVVIISNGVQTHQLKEYAQPVNSNVNVYYYSIDSANLSSAFTGKLNTTYTLSISADGQQYNATTTIPATTRQLDSLFYKPVPVNSDTGKVRLMLRATDAPGYGDYIRYFTKRNSEPFYPGFASVFDDQIIDGTSYEIEVERGVDRNIPRKDGDAFFLKGDTVTLKLCHIDKATYDFWRTMEFSYASIGNPFSAPTRVQGNISNNALGYFGGYACIYRTLIIPR